MTLDEAQAAVRLAVSHEVLARLDYENSTWRMGPTRRAELEAAQARTREAKQRLFEVKAEANPAFTRAAND